jgi:DNA-binding transcriptional MerR regulator
MSIKEALFNLKEQQYLESKLYEKHFPQLDKTLSEPRFTIADLGISPRDATYWDKQGILPKLIGKGMRRKYTLPQALWIRLITQFRKLEVSTKLIKEFKEKVLQEHTAEDLLKDPKNRAILQQVINQQGDKYNLDEIYEKGEYDKAKSFRLYDYLVLAVVVFRKEIAFFVMEDGNNIPYCPTNHNELQTFIPEFNSIIASPHITVSLSEAYCELVEKWEPLDFFKEISLISEEEQRILDAIRTKGVKKVIINYKKNGKADRIEITKDKKIDLASRVAENLSRYAYEDITIKSAKGTILHCEKTVKVKL